MVSADPVTAVFRTVSWGFVCPAGRNRCNFPEWLFWDHTLESTGMDFQMFGGTMYLIFKNHLGKDLFCILIFDKCSGFGGLI